MCYPRHCLAHYQYFLQYHQRYSLQCATYASKSTTLPTLAHTPRHPRCHVTQASMQQRNPSQHATHASTLPTEARQHATHTTHGSTPPTPPMPPTLARHPRKHTSHSTHCSTYNSPFKHFGKAFLKDFADFPLHEVVKNLIIYFAENF